MRTKEQILRQLRGGLVVSCQALEHEPLFGAEIMAAMARAAYEGGAVGIRANTPVDIRAIKAACPLPVIGLYKKEYPGFDMYITPTMAEIKAVIEAGADVVAVDATDRPRPDGLTLFEMIAEVHASTDAMVLADISTFEEGVVAARAGADIISTTLSGYTPYSRQDPTPDFELVDLLASSVSVPVVAEGRIWSVDEVRRALESGAFAVVVGTAITRPQEIVRRWVQGLG